jgi:Protein of unknown function (DUF1615)
MLDQAASHRQLTRAGWAVVATLVTAGCVGDDPYRMPPRSPEAVRAQIASLMPANVTDRQGWAADIYAAFSSMKLATNSANLCAVLAITEQESGFQVDPPVPNLAKVARDEILKRAGAKGIPEFMVRAALQLESPDGRSYDQRLSTVRTERELSRMYEDFIDEVPLGKQLFAGWNPVHTGGPMQVSVDFAAEHTKLRPYPYDTKDTLRHEVFTRRGGLYFGIAHLLDYAAPYGEMVHRFADFNAGHFASRNAAFQQALAAASERKLDLDGDLIDPAKPADRLGETEAAARALGAALGMTEAEIRRELARGRDAGFESTTLYLRVFALGERKAGKPLARAVVPRIQLQSPKITRQLTTEWFATRVDGRFQKCLARDAASRSAALVDPHDHAVPPSPSSPHDRHASANSNAAAISGTTRNSAPAA